MRLISGSADDRDAESLFRAKPISEIRNVESATNKQIQDKKEELRQLVGTRYRDLIDSADSILQMKSASESISSNISSIHHSIRSLSISVLEAPSPKLQTPPNPTTRLRIYGIACRVKYLVDTPENIWGCLDESMFLEAAARYIRAKHVHSILMLPDGDLDHSKILSNFPLLQHQWQIVESFKAQISQRSRERLLDRGLSVAAYADALAAVAVTDDLDPEQVLRLFLEARKNWILHTLTASAGNGNATSSVAISAFCDVLNIIQVTIGQVGELFLHVMNDMPLFYKVILDSPPASQLFGGIPNPDEEVRLWKSFRDKLESVTVMLHKTFISSTCWSWVRDCGAQIISKINGRYLIDTIPGGQELRTAEKLIRLTMESKEVLQESLEWLKRLDFTSRISLICFLSDCFLSFSFFLMDSATLLDRALFQLTPTRTRFNLVLFYKGKNEKLASGLFEPFICHLKFARDQISKGGYSITLQPPAPSTPWFTKATFERFVRFVSTPAVLERFVTIESEILQIERSIQANELANADGKQGEDANGYTNERNNGIILEENSKVQLQRLLETRKALLWKEQAMTYARGLVAGFAMENMEHLISFADAFGATRLREACINFKELCKKKHADRHWMEELAAVEACSPAELPLFGTSGIVLANGISNPNMSVVPNFPINGASTGDHAPNESLEASKSDSTCAGAVDCKKDENSPASDKTPSSTTIKYQVPLQWLNQMPQHMYNFQGQLPQYQGYPFHPMQPVPLPYLMNMQWPPNTNQKSSSKPKKKSANRKQLDYSGEERETESSGSDSGSESGSDVQQEDRRQSSPDPPYRKKNRKKSSRTVVIRNINYITPKRRSGEKDHVSDGSYSGEDDLIDADSLKQKVDDAVKLLKDSGKSNSSNNKRRGADKNHHTAEKSTDGSYQSDSNDLDVNAAEGGKRNGNWDALQNLLMKGEENASVNVEWKQAKDVQEHFIARNLDGEISATTPLNFESQKVSIKRADLVDSFVVTERDETDESRVKLDDFVNGERYRPVMKKGDCVEVDLLPTGRSAESGNKLGDFISASANESAVIRCGKEEDWFAGNHHVKPENQHSANDHMLFNGDRVLSVESDHLYSQKSVKDVIVDDSFMVAARPAGDNQDDSQWKTDISMVADLTSHSKPDGAIDVSQDKHKIVDAEPIDLCMVLERNPGYESSRDSWTMDYQIDLSFTETNRSAASKCDDDDVEKVPSNHKNIAKQNEAKKPAKEARSKALNGPIGKIKAENVSRSKKPSLVSRSAIQKSKLEKEEEMRRKMEELRIERQKRIAERTAASGYASPVSKKSPVSTKSDQKKNVSSAQASNRMNSIKLRAT